MRTIQSGSRTSSLVRAIAELGRIAKTLFLLTYVDDEAYRRRILVQLNRGEARHRLARAVFHGQRGELSQRYREGQEDQLGALGLVVNAIILGPWCARSWQPALPSTWCSASLAIAAWSAAGTTATAMAPRSALAAAYSARVSHRSRATRPHSPSASVCRSAGHRAKPRLARVAALANAGRARPLPTVYRSCSSRPRWPAGWKSPRWSSTSRPDRDGRRQHIPAGDAGRWPGYGACILRRATDPW